MKDVLAASLMGLIIVSVVPYASAEQMLLSVGEVQTTSCTAPEACYKLLREGRPVKPLKSVMEVMNGDIIRPLSGKTVTLIYWHTACGEKTISNETMVLCSPASYSRIGRNLGFLAHWLKKIKDIKRETLEEDLTMTIKAPGSEKVDRSCFPDESFTVSPWPMESSTLLYREPIYFRWDDIFLWDVVPPCSDSKLIIVSNEEGLANPIVKNMKVGELIRVVADFNPGTSYQWHVEKDGKTVSDVYHFTILGEKESDNIQSHLAEVGNQYEGQCPGLKQALYLQIISDSTPGLDLYADSLRMIRELKECTKEKELLNQLFECIWDHSLGESCFDKYTRSHR